MTIEQARGLAEVGRCEIALDRAEVLTVEQIERLRAQVQVDRSRQPEPPADRRIHLPRRQRAEHVRPSVPDSSTRASRAAPGASWRDLS
jgi:hypothetical protein